MERYLEFIQHHYMLCMAFAVVTFLLIQELIESSQRKYAPLSPLMAVTKMNAMDVAIVDVRPLADFNKGHIDNALNMPMDKLQDQLAKLSALKDKPLIVACETGSLSSAACKLLSKAGFSDVFHLTGGMVAWDDCKLPIKISGKSKS